MTRLFSESESPWSSMSSATGALFIMSFSGLESDVAGLSPLFSIEGSFLMLSSAVTALGSVTVGLEGASLLVTGSGLTALVSFAFITFGVELSLFVGFTSSLTFGVVESATSCSIFLTSGIGALLFSAVFFVRSLFVSDFGTFLSLILIAAAFFSSLFSFFSVSLMVSFFSVSLWMSFFSSLLSFFSVSLMVSFFSVSLMVSFFSVSLLVSFFSLTSGIDFIFEFGDLSSFIFLSTDPSLDCAALFGLLKWIFIFRPTWLACKQKSKQILKVLDGTKGNCSQVQVASK